MKKQILSLFAVIAFAAFLFTSCETDDAIITLLGDNPAEFDLGEEYVEPGFEVDGGKEDDVVTSFSPVYDKFKVNEYIATYSLGNASATRTVHVTSEALAGTYAVEDVIDDYGTLEYEVSVAQKAGTYNVLRIDGFNDWNIVVDATVNGNDITIAKQTPADWTSEEYVEGTGTYYGEDQNLVSFDYYITYLSGGDIVTESGTATYTRVVK